MRVASTTLTQLCGIGALTASKILGLGTHAWWVEHVWCRHQQDWSFEDRYAS